MEIDFNDVNELLEKTTVVAQKGVYPFSFATFSKSQLKKLIDDPKCHEILFLPVEDLGKITLLAVGVEENNVGRAAFSPAIQSDCPPRCKILGVEGTDKTNFISQFKPKLEIETTTT